MSTVVGIHKGGSILTGPFQLPIMPLPLRNPFFKNRGDGRTRIGRKGGEGRGRTIAYSLVGIQTRIYGFPEPLGDSEINSGETTALFLFILLHLLDTGIMAPLRSLRVGLVNVQKSVQNCDSRSGR